MGADTLSVQTRGICHYLTTFPAHDGKKYTAIATGANGITGAAIVDVWPLSRNGGDPFTRCPVDHLPAAGSMSRTLLLISKTMHRRAGPFVQGGSQSEGNSSQLLM
jgi:hypothetical protein